MMHKLTTNWTCHRREGEILPPWYYGLAYRDYVYGQDVFMPMPLNWLARWGRYVRYLWDRMRSRPARWDVVPRGAVEAAYWDGVQDGRERGRNEMEARDRDAAERITRMFLCG